jgi:hypothetical protein
VALEVHNHRCYHFNGAWAAVKTLTSVTKTGRNISAVLIKTDVTILARLINGSLIIFVNARSNIYQRNRHNQMFGYWLAKHVCWAAEIMRLPNSFSSFSTANFGFSQDMHATAPHQLQSPSGHQSGETNTISVAAWTLSHTARRSHYRWFPTY